MKNNDYIKFIRNSLLCTGCGICVGVCPSNNILLYHDNKRGIYLPKIKSKKCIDCGICSKICPRFPSKYINSIAKTFNRPHFILGNYVNLYIGYSNNKQIRFDCSSGGMITQLLLFALESKLIDGAILTRLKDENPLEPEVIIARTKKEIIQCSKSKYCPVPLDIIINKIIKSENEEKLAFVGLPCHIDGIKKIETIFPQIKKKIIIYFGLFCSHNLNFHGTYALLNKLGLKRKDILKISYRGVGWPGKINVISKEKKSFYLNCNGKIWNSIFNNPLFIPIYCLFCHDLTAESSDLSFGDAWLNEILINDKIGRSLIISRNIKGENLLNKAIEHKIITIENIDEKKVIDSQKDFLFLKKVNLLFRLKILNHIKPFLNLPIEKLDIKYSSFNRLLGYFLIFTNIIGSHFNFFLKRIPIKFIKIIPSILYYFLSKINNISQIGLNRKRLNIFIINTHWDNRGDESAIRAMISSIKKCISYDSIKMMLVTKKVGFNPFRDLEIMELFPKFDRTKRSTIIFLLDIIIFLISLGKLGLSKEFRLYLKTMENTDVVIHGPGGACIGDTNSNFLWELSFLFRLFVAIIKRKIIFFYSVSLGPFNRTFRNILRRFILKRITCIVTRESLSKIYLKNQLNIKSFETIDSTLQNNVQISYIHKFCNLREILNKLEKEKVIGMTLTDLKWHPKYQSNYILIERIKKSILQFVDYLLKNNYDLLLIPQIFNYNYEINFLKEVQNMNKQKIMILPQNIDSYGQQIVISKLYSMVNMRYHPNIFSSKSYIPFLAISYEHKIIGFLNRLKISEFLRLNVEDISYIGLVDRFEYLVNNYELIRNKLKQKVPSLKKLSNYSTKILNNLIKKRYT